MGEPRISLVGLVYELTEALKPVRHYYLGDPEKVRMVIQSVADQLKKKS